MLGVRLYKYIFCYRIKIFMVLLFHIFGTDIAYLRVLHSREIGGSYVCNTYNWCVQNGMDIKSHPKSIKLPDTVEVFGNLKNAKRFAIDIGNVQNCFVSVNARNTWQVASFAYLTLRLTGWFELQIIYSYTSNLQKSMLYMVMLSRFHKYTRYFFLYDVLSIFMSKIPRKMPDHKCYRIKICDFAE